MLILLTGGTGFVGSHVADVLTKRGDHVRALVRSNSDTAHLQSLNVEIVTGDFTDAEAVRKAVEGIDAIVHCAAKVGDWGHVDEFRKINVEGLRVLLKAVRGKPLKRFVHLSSLGVYEARHHYGTDESEPLPSQHIDSYTQSKVECETLALEEHRKYATPITILRPGFIYGPRDRTLLPRLAQRLKNNDVVYMAKGKNALNTTFVGNLVDAILLALDKSEAVGEIYNITDGELVTKRRFFENVADGMGLPRPKMSIPIWLARPLAKWREAKFRHENRPEPPRITQAILKFAGLNLDFSIAKARMELGYEPKTSFQDGMEQAVQWLRETYPELNQKK